MNLSLDEISKLSQQDIEKLTSAQIMNACNQLDNKIIRSLRGTDENIAKCTQIITQKILPSLERLGMAELRVGKGVEVYFDDNHSFCENLLSIQ